MTPESEKKAQSEQENFISSQCWCQYFTLDFPQLFCYFQYMRGSLSSMPLSSRRHILNVILGVGLRHPAIHTWSGRLTWFLASNPDFADPTQPTRKFNIVKIKCWKKKLAMSLRSCALHSWLLERASFAILTARLASSELWSIFFIIGAFVNLNPR